MHPVDRQVPQASAQHSSGHWRIELLGGLKATSVHRTIERFPGQAVARLLARLALWPRHRHPREELVDLLWPGVSLDVGRARLRQVLSNLRYLLEGPGGDAGAVLVADRMAIGLVASAFSCDVAEFEAACRSRQDAAAAALYPGELLPGFYDDWVLQERARLAALHDALQARRRAAAAAVDDTVPMPAPSASTASADTRQPVRRLPGYLGSFVGREAELGRLVEAIQAHRLVTLSGPGGAGKTRLATEAARVGTGFDPVLFVSLHDCVDRSQLIERLRVAARVPAAASAVASFDAVVAALDGRAALIVFDNFEQLVDRDGASVLADLLAALPLARALVTSRRVLQLAGEHEVVLEPLPLPPLDASLASASSNPSMMLFVDRARAVRGGFRLTQGNLPDLIAICRSLEGLPLALEIAASRIRTYSATGLRSALGRRLELLVRTGHPPGGEARHGSLRAAIDWSWRLLDAPAQAFLVTLTVFRGGCCATDARAVSGRPETHARLDALVADSLLQVDSHADIGDDAEPRFDMLDAVRAFVVEQIDAPLAATLRDAHRRHFLDIARFCAERFRPVPEATLDNVVQALRTALADGAHADAVALALAMKVQWESVGASPEVLELLLQATHEIEPGTPGRSQILGLLARLLLVGGRAAEAIDLAGQALDDARDIEARAEALFAHTRVDWVCKRDAARAIGPARECLELARRAGLRALEASAASLVGAITLWGFGDAREAETLYAAAESLYLSLGNARGSLQASHGRMGCLYTTARHGELIRQVPALEARAIESNNVEARIVLLNLLTASHMALRQFGDALATARRETRIARDHHKIYNIVHGLWGQGRCLARLRRPVEAAQLAAFSERYWIRHLGELPAQEQRELRRVRRLLGLQLGATAFEAAWALGAALPDADGLALGCGATDNAHP